MSQYGTHPEYQRGWDDGCEETSERYAPLLAACHNLLARWADNKNLSASAQAIAKALATLPGERS